MTDEHEAITSLAKAIAEAAKAGRWDVVEDLSKTMRQMRAAVDIRSSTVQGEHVNASQEARRHRAIAQATAGDDVLLQAITTDPLKRWRSGNAYAEKRLGVSPASFANYRSGKTAAPKSAQAKVDADFPKLGYRFPRVVD